ncbi:MAG: phosphocarrier protein HPr [Candidatus Azotimanducaceae bacterium]|jgi:phosphocarrier protein HPr
MALTESIEIQNKLGLHARAASVFVKVAQEFSSTIEVESASGSANGKSIMSMMMLQASIGSLIKITVEGDDENETMSAVLELINQKFGEEV